MIQNLVVTYINMYFEPSDHISVEGIKTEVINRITAYDNRATIDDIEVHVQNNGKRFDVIVYVDYKGEKRHVGCKI
jgi:hypothetical protein